MNYQIKVKNENNNKICYIEYTNGKIIELTRNNNHLILNSEKYLFLILNDDKIDKIFDINNKKFITKALEVKIIYNKYKIELRKKSIEQKKKILNP